jgi:hypothetical protein
MWVEVEPALPEVEPCSDALLHELDSQREGQRKATEDLHLPHHHPNVDRNPYWEYIVWEMRTDDGMPVQVD